MNRLTCEMCNSTDMVKQDGMFVCSACGTKYSVEEAKRMMIDGTVDVQGTIKVDNTDFVERYLQNARRAKQKEDWEEVKKYYNMVEQNVPSNIEAIFYSTFAQVKLSLLEAETKDKRQSVFNILIKGVSIIDDNYDSASEEQEKLLYEIMDDIKGLKNGAIVPTTHLAEYVTKNGYGNIVDRNQIVKEDSLELTYDMVDEAIEAYMDSLANIIIKHSPRPIEILFMQNVKYLSMESQVHKKIATHISGYKTPEDSCIEIASQIKIHQQSTLENINSQINELAKTICPFYMSGEILDKRLRRMVQNKLRTAYPNTKALSRGCYVATAVYGSYDCPQVWTLRRYRDYTLAKTWYGRVFIKTYYAISPTLVKWFGHTEWFKRMWQGKLDRMVEKLQSEGFEATPYKDKEW